MRGGTPTGSCARRGGRRDGRGWRRRSRRGRRAGRWRGAARGLSTGTKRHSADDRHQGDCCDTGGGDAAGRGTGGWHVTDPFDLESRCGVPLGLMHITALVGRWTHRRRSGSRWTFVRRRGGAHLSRRQDAVVVTLEDQPERQFVGRCTVEQRHARTDLHRVEGTEDLVRAPTIDRKEEPDASRSLVPRTGCARYARASSSEPMAKCWDIALRPRPAICGKMNQIQWLVLRPRRSSARTVS